MAVASSLTPIPGSISCRSCRPHISIHQSREFRFQFVKAYKNAIGHSSPVHRDVKCATTGSNGYQGVAFDGGSNHEPVWLSLIKDVGWSLRSLARFLAEQPSQLKYIEWPTFQNTLKTATLTLVLVALLIVALSTVDSTLSYVLALLLRKPA